MIIIYLGSVYIGKIEPYTTYMKEVCAVNEYELHCFLSI